ncbi:MAG: DUF4358 domain-containing protein [Clostridia bacterium]|nr:DUF4358 domain-containing protein [Clostridia bacterium]
MKKILLAITSLLMCACLLTACGTTEKTLNDTPLSEAMDKINAEVFGGGENMRVIDSLDKLELYYSIDPADVEEFAAEVSKNSATEIDEVILIKAVDTDAAKRIAEKLEIRLQSQKDLCASYSAELLAVADKSEVRTQDVLVSLIIAEEYDKAVSICDETLFS